MAASQHMIAFGNPVPLRITGSITLMAWFNAASIGADILTKWATTGDQRSWEFGIRTTGGGVVQASVSSDGTAGTRVSATQVAYTPNAWNCVFFVYDGTNIYVEVNGIKGADVAYSSGIFDSTAEVEMGKFVSGGWFGGTIGEVAIFNGALSVSGRANHRLSTKWRYS